MVSAQIANPPGAMRRNSATLPLHVLIAVFQALLGSMLSISTALVFGIFALVVMADMRIDLAITVMALGVNGMLFSLLLLGSLLPERAS